MKVQTNKPGVHMLVNTSDFRRKYNKKHNMREDYMPLGKDLERGTRMCWVVTKEELELLNEVTPENPGTVTAYDGRGNRRCTYKFIGYKISPRIDYLTGELKARKEGVELILDGRLTGPDAIFWEWSRLPQRGNIVVKNS